MKYLSKKPMESKKFIAFLISQVIFSTFFVLWWVALGGAAIAFYEALIGVVLLICMTTLQVGYILGEASLDRFAMIAKDLTPWGEDGTGIPDGANPTAGAKPAKGSTPSKEEIV